MAAHLTATLKPWPVPDRIVEVEDFDAVADGVTVNTKLINEAIAACAGQGGGVVRLTKGDYVAGALDLKSGVMLEVAEGARGLGSMNLADYPDRIAKHPAVFAAVRGCSAPGRKCRRLRRRALRSWDWAC